MSFKLTLVLLAAAIVAVAGFTLAHRQTPATGGPIASATVNIIDLRFADVTNVDVKFGDKQTVIDKTNLLWRLSKPVEDSNVDQAKISGLVGQLAPLNSDRPVA